MIKILICGATGFIGRNLVNYFSSNPEYHIFAVYNNRKPFEVLNAANKISWVKADLRSSKDVLKVIDGMDIVIQAAATTSGSKDIVSKPYIHITDNALMNSLLLRQSMESKVKHFIFFSCTVMYKNSETPLNETDVDNTKIFDGYFGVANTKLYIEKMCEFYSKISDTKFSIIRHSNLYGPYDKYDFEKCHVTPANIRKVADNLNPIPLWGDGTEVRDIIHVDDMVSGFATVAENVDTYDIYNVCYGEGYTVMEVLELIKEIEGNDNPIEFVNNKAPMIPKRLLSNEKLRKLGWKPKYDLRSGLKNAIDWYKEHKNEYDPNSKP